jgi:hypothetical protein
MSNNSKLFAPNALKDRTHQAHPLKYSKLCGGNRLYGPVLVIAKNTRYGRLAESGRNISCLPESLFWKSTAYRTDLYSISQILSRKVAHIEENADCFWKPKKVRFFTSLAL